MDVKAVDGVFVDMFGSDYRQIWRRGLLNVEVVRRWKRRTDYAGVPGGGEPTTGRPGGGRSPTSSRLDGGVVALGVTGDSVIDRGRNADPGAINGVG